MLHSILLGLDDTPAALRAKELTLQLARTHDASITGLAVVDVERISKPEPVPLGGDSFKQHKDMVLVGRARSELGHVAQAFEADCTAAAVKHTTRIVEDDAIAALVSEADRHDALVIGRDSTFHTDATPVSEVVERIVRSNPRPVIVVPDCKAAGATDIVACDGSVASMKALQVYCLLGLAAQREVVVASVAGDRAAAEEMTTHAVEYLRARGVRVRPHVVQSEADPAEALMALAQELGARLIVMGAYGRRGWREFLLGSTTDRLLAHATCPLFIHH